MHANLWDHCLLVKASGFAASNRIKRKTNSIRYLSWKNYVENKLGLLSNGPTVRILSNTLLGTYTVIVYDNYGSMWNLLTLWSLFRYCLNWQGPGDQGRSQSPNAQPVSLLLSQRGQHMQQVMHLRATDLRWPTAIRSPKIRSLSVWKDKDKCITYWPADFAARKNRAPLSILEMPQA